MENSTNEITTNTNIKKISIITPTYNSGKTLEKTILSVINQPQIIPREYIIIDGGSNDNTREIIHKYAQHIQVFISEPDQGSYDAMNKGINLATGDIIGIINADDWYCEDALKIVVEEFMNNSDIDILYSPIHNYYENEFVGTFKPGKLEQLAIRFTLNHPSCFIKKIAYQQTGLYANNYRIAADYEMIMRLFYSGYHFHFVSTPLAAYSLNGMSSSTNPWQRAQLIYECWQISKKADIYLQNLPSQLDNRRIKAYLLWILNEIFALPIRFLLKPNRARKLKMQIKKYIQLPVSEKYGEW